MSPGRESGSRAREFLGRAASWLYLLLLAEGVPFVVLYRSEGPTMGRYTPRYVYGVLAPFAALALAAIVLALAPRASRRVLAATLGRIPKGAAAVILSAAALASAAYALKISDEYVSLLAAILFPGLALLAWERAFGSVEPLMAGAPLLLAGALLFLAELPEFVASGPLLVWGDGSTFATLFPRKPPFIGPGGRLRPGLDGRMRAAEYGRGARIVTNGEGFRNGSEFAAPPAPEEIRILSLGDSFSTGFGADQDAFFGPLLERDLGAAEPGREIRVMNAEVSDPAYGLLYLQQFGMRHRPRVVVYGLSANDMMQAEEFYGSDRLFRLGPSGRLEANPAFDPAAGSAWVRFREFAYPAAGSPGAPMPAILASLLSKLVRFRFFSGVASAAAREGGRPSDMPGFAEEFERADGRKRMIDGTANLGFFYAAGGEPIERMYAAFTDLIVAMDRTAREGGARFLLVVYPQRYQVQEGDWDVMRRRWSLSERDFDLTLENRRLAALGAARSIAICDPLQAFRDASRGHPLYLPAGDMHFNRRGHEVAAREAARCLAGVESPG